MTNAAVVTGLIASPIKEDHVVVGETIYTSVIQIKRLSGTNDTVPITIPGGLLQTLDPVTLAAPVTVYGQVRSYDKIVDGAGRLYVTLYAKAIYPEYEADSQNDIKLEGAICKPPIFRITPFGREICDLMLAVGRGYGKVDYIPCIAWGFNARYASGFKLGDRINVNGRLQSRQYEKLLDSGDFVTRTAYELSIFTIDRALKGAMA